MSPFVAKAGMQAHRFMLLLGENAVVHCHHRQVSAFVSRYSSLNLYILMLSVGLNIMLKLLLTMEKDVKGKSGCSMTT